MILFIDNYDSFVHNLARYAGRLGRERRVVRNDAITLKDIHAARPEAIIISPGPCTPREAGVSLELVRAFHAEIPILGVCLGHQCIGEVFGGRTVRASRPMHGKSSPVIHDGRGVFQGLPSPLDAGRYHSLAVEFPGKTTLTVTARAQDEDTIMGLSHPDFPVHGIQFHPESVLTAHGLEMMANFMACADAWNEKRKAA